MRRSGTFLWQSNLFLNCTFPMPLMPFSHTFLAAGEALCRICVHTRFIKKESIDAVNVGIFRYVLCPQFFSATPKRRLPPSKTAKNCFKNTSPRIPMLEAGLG